MADKLACTYRYVAEDDGQPVRVVLRPGDDPKDLPKDVRDDLKARRLIVDEDRLTSEGLRVPIGMENPDQLSPRERADRSLKQRGEEPRGATEVSASEEQKPDTATKKAASKKGD